MKFASLLSLFAMLVIAAGVLLAEKPVVNDDSISDSVRTRLAADRDVGAAGIDVKVSHGVVELHGSVKKESTRVKAERIAKKVKGVRSVVNQLQVSPAGGPASPPPK